MTDFTELTTNVQDYITHYFQDNEISHTYMLKMWNNNVTLLFSIFEENFKKDNCPSWVDFNTFREDSLLKMFLRLIDFQKHASGNDRISFWNELACPFVSEKIDIGAGTIQDELEQDVGSYHYSEFNFN